MSVYTAEWVLPGHPDKLCDAIADAIIELMNDRELARSLAESGKNYIYRHMNTDRAARNYEELYYAALQQAS